MVFVITHAAEIGGMFQPVHKDVSGDGVTAVRG
jgi:hypothetical protein